MCIVALGGNLLKTGYSFGEKGQMKKEKRERKEGGHTRRERREFE